MTETLRDLRLQHGMSHADLVAAVAQKLGEPSKTPRASVQWEFRGIKNGDIRAALCDIYSVDLLRIRTASENSKLTQGPPLPRGRQKKYHN